MTVQRADVPFCVVSRRVYSNDMMPVASLASKGHLNGAKCRPCTPLYTGPLVSGRKGGGGGVRDRKGER